MLNIGLEISDLVAELVNRIRRTGIIIFPEAVIDRQFRGRRNDFGLAEFCGDPDEVIKQGPDKALLKLHFLNIQKAKITCFEFKIRKDILKQTEKEGLFNYPKIENIRVKCAPEIAYYLYEQCKAKKLVITLQEDGSLIVVLPPSTEADALHWILGEGGDVEMLEPQWLRENNCMLAKKNGGNQPSLNWSCGIQFFLSEGVVIPVSS